MTYAGSIMPTGTIGCAVLNLPDEMITRLDAPCMMLNQLLTGIGLKNVDLQLSMEQQARSDVMGTQPLAALLIHVIPVLGHLSYSLRQYKMTLTAFAAFLQENAEIRTPTGYAATFGQFFRENATLKESNPSWMALTNATVQYVPVIHPGNAEAQLVKRMHFVSFVGMFCADLFEGLCVGHAPKKCAVCGK